MSRTKSHALHSAPGWRRWLTRAGALGACLTAGTLLAATAMARPAAPHAPAAALQKAADALVSAGVPGVVVLTRDGDRTTTVSSGLAEVAHRTPMRPADRFRVASLAKSYTATVVLQLVGEGKLRLGDSVERWLPGVVPHGERITIRELLNHTSGLADFERLPVVLKPYLSGDLGHHWSPRTLVRLAVAHKPLFAPGTGESYSSTNYLLAGLIVEARTGHSLGAELDRRIFAPLHLDATTFPTTPQITGPHAHGYLVLGKPTASDVTGLSPFPWAAGATVTTAADVADFYRGLLSGRLLTPSLLAAMETTHAQRNVDFAGQRYGLGLMRFPTSCGIAWGHNGVFPGYGAIAWTSPDGQRQAVVLINKDTGSLSHQAGALYARLIAKAFCASA